MSNIAKIIFTMTNSKELFNELVSRITLPEDKPEIQSIVYLLLNKRLGLTKTEILAGKAISSVDPNFFNAEIEKLNNQVPIQYVLGETEFYGRIFNVNPSVLIPRPETELLIQEIKTELLKQAIRSPKIVDIGTGSGCIAITLALEIPHAQVQATDLSDEAIHTAEENRNALGAHVKFHAHNVLTDKITFGQFDVIVSNPPYIAESEKITMKENVLAYEPHLALFAPANEPLAFYEAIALKGKSNLFPGGSVWVEINENFGKEVAAIFKKHGYHAIRIIKDLDNKDRMVTAKL
jgi:release factor glutamine methyltransferase